MYFFTTPLEEILVMLNTVLSPLNERGPILKYLNMMMCILNELTESISQFKMDILEKARQIFKNQQLDEIQKRVENMQIDTYIYKMRISRNENLAILSFILLILFLWK